MLFRSSWWASVNLGNDAVIEPLNRLASTMHKHGAKIMIQATHMGRRSAWHGESWPHLVSPSGIREPVHRGNAKTIEVEEIHRIIRDFAQAARRVKAAGMDGTPGFVIGLTRPQGLEGVRISGAVPFETFDAALKAIEPKR